MIKAIDTRYGGKLFRSRLEARWAVYFDELGTSWQYEEEGFELGDGLRYLPDFYLTRHGIYVEIKPAPYSWKEHSKCRRLANLSRKPVVEAIGLPSVNPFTVIQPYSYWVCPNCNKKENFILGQDEHCFCSVKRSKIDAIIENEAILLLHSGKPSYTPLYFATYMDDYTNDKIIQNAIRVATEARFEFENQK